MDRLVLDFNTCLEIGYNFVFVSEDPFVELQRTAAFHLEFDSECLIGEFKKSTY